MPHRVQSSAFSMRTSVKSTASQNSIDGSKVTIGVWILRLFLLIIMFVFIMPISLLLVPWWIWLQPFERSCPNLINGYYRIVTWSFTISRNIRSYRQHDRFTEQLKY